MKGRRLTTRLRYTANPYQFIVIKLMAVLPTSVVCSSVKTINSATMKKVLSFAPLTGMLVACEDHRSFSTQNSNARPFSVSGRNSSVNGSRLRGVCQACTQPGNGQSLAVWRTDRVLSQHHCVDIFASCKIENLDGQAFSLNIPEQYVQ